MEACTRICSSNSNKRNNSKASRTVRPTLAKVLVPAPQARVRAPRKASPSLSPRLAKTGPPPQCRSRTAPYHITSQARHNVRAQASRWVPRRSSRVARPPRAAMVPHRPRASKPSRFPNSSNHSTSSSIRGCPPLSRRAQAQVTRPSRPPPSPRACRPPGCAGRPKRPPLCPRRRRRRWRARRARPGSWAWASLAT